MPLENSLHHGLLHMTVFIELQLYCDHCCVCKANYLFVFAKYSFITKYCMLNQFDNTT